MTERITLTAQEAEMYGDPPADFADLDMGPDGGLSEDGIPSLFRDEGRSELANARRFVVIHGGDYRYCPALGSLTWDGKRWAVDELAGEAMAKSVAARNWQELAGFIEHGGEGPVKEMCRFARATASAPGQRNLLKLAQSEPGIPISVTDLNRDPFDFNCANCTVDLRTGRARAHRREDLITQLCPTPYDAAAECPTFLRFLRRIMDENDDLIGFIQRALGMSSTAAIRDHVLFVPYGTGQNGKSTLFNAIFDTLGPDYSMKAPFGLLMAKSHEQHPCERADLFGKRCAVCIENDEGQRLSESLTKELTGGDRVRARFMRKDFFEFAPSHHLWLAVNHKPVIRGTDTGIWRRIRLIPFSVSIPEEEQDKQLGERLKAERPGILAWLVRGGIAWAEHGLGEPDEVRMATAAYRNEQDVLATFLAERCEVNGYFQVKASDLYSEYAKWADSAGEYVLSQRRFGQALVERGFERYTSNGTWYRGIGLRDTTHEQ